MSAIITATDLQTNYLIGVRLTDATGSPFPATLYTTAIANAISWFELTTKIHTSTITLTAEAHDYQVNEYLRFAFIQLYEYPIQSVQSVTAVYPTGQTIIMFPSNWIKVYNAGGHIMMVPTAGTLTQVLIGQGGSYVPLLSGRLDFLPQLFQVAYTAGFNSVDGVPDLVNDTIGRKAAILVMEAAGSTVIEPGIQSVSLGQDGLSQSMSTMVGQFGPYTGRIQSYTNAIQQNVETLTQQYKGVRFTVV